MFEIQTQIATRLENIHCLAITPDHQKQRQASMGLRDHNSVKAKFYIHKAAKGSNDIHGEILKIISNNC